MNPENKPVEAGMAEPVREFFHDIKMARHLTDRPEYFYQSPTPEQEKGFEETWNNLAKRVQRRAPKTIDTFFGKVEFIRDQKHFNNLLVKYILPKHRHEKASLLQNLEPGRKKMFTRLNALSPEEIKKLKDKAASTPFYVIDFKFKKED